LLKAENFKKRLRVWFIPIIATLFLVSVGVIGSQQAIAYEGILEKNEYIDFQKYTGNRLLVFNDTTVDYCITDNEQNPAFNEIAVNAVKAWHDRIVDVTQNSKVWDMTMHVYPQDESICDGYVNYYGTPEPTYFQLSGVAGFSHPQTPVANVTIYTDDYQSTLLNMAEEDENFWKNMSIDKFQDIVKSEEHEQFDTEMIKRITLHEIGHSLSLNHPNTDDGNLQEASGIMGYDMAYNQIDDGEVINIVKAYPNGFTKVSKSESIKLGGDNKKSLTLGEVVNLTIELPNKNGKLPPSGIEVYIFPEGTSSQKTENAPIKIIRIQGQKQLVNNGGYLEDIHSIMTHWGSSTKVMSIQFKVVKEFENADMIVIAHNIGGFEEQWFLDDVLSVKKALFSNLLLDFETTEYKYYLMGSNPNRMLEKESAFKIKQEKLFTESLSECLSHKNMKKCTDEIKVEDFKQDMSPPPIWMP
jgi:predicted Zn-dependent protease